MSLRARMMNNTKSSIRNWIQRKQITVWPGLPPAEDLNDIGVKMYKANLSSCSINDA